MMEGPADTKKVDEGPAAAVKFDGSSRYHNKSSRKVPWTNGKLTECPADARKVDTS